MRVLFSCLPGFGHFNPMVPLAQALTDAGHDVAFATAPRFCQRVVEPAGFSAFAAGLSPVAVEEQTMQLPAGAGIHDGDVWAFGARMFAQVAAPAKVADLVTIIERWQPRLVVHDAIDFAGPIAAARAQLPWVSHSFGALQPDEFWSLASDLVAPVWREWNVVPDERAGMFRYLYLDICPPSFQADDASRVAVRQLLRPVPFDTSGASVVPSWFESLPRQPTVYVTMGTIFNDTPGVFEAVTAGLGDIPVNVIVTIGLDRDPAELGPPPANVHIERWIPQSLIFNQCQAVVCHGGSGTTLAALAHGLPLLVLPQGANQFWNAERCVAIGAGLSLELSQVGGVSIRNSIHRLLVEPEFGRAARDVQREIEQMPEPGDVVGRLVGLAQDAISLSSPPRRHNAPIAPQ